MSKSKRVISGTLVVFLVVALLVTTAACGFDSESSGQNSMNVANAAQPSTNTQSPDPTPTESPISTPVDDPGSVDISSEETADAQTNDIVISASDARDYAEVANPVPLGQWVFYQEENWETGEYEPYYVRIADVGDNSSTVNDYLDTLKSSDGTYTEGYIYSWASLIDSGADVEFRYFDFEVYYDPDYKAASWGISQNVEPAFHARPIDAEDFGLVADGKGHMHSGLGRLVSLFREELPKPGDLLHLHGVFPMLKDYEESEYVIYIEWYDGAKNDELKQVVYFAAEG